MAMKLSIRYSTLVFVILFLTECTLSTHYIVNIAKSINNYAAGNDNYGMGSNIKSIVESGVKLERGEDGAKEELIKNMAKFAITDVGSQMAEPLEEYMQEFADRKIMAKTKKAIQDQNMQLYNQGKSILNKDYQTANIDVELKKEMKNIEPSFEKTKASFNKEWKELKKDNINVYKKIKAKTKWVRFGRKAVRGVSPLIDVISIGFDISDLKANAVGTNAHTSAALGIASAALSIGGFFAGLLSIVFPPAAVLATGLSALSTAVGFSSTTIGLMSDTQVPATTANGDESTPETETKDQKFARKIAEYSQKLEETLDKSISFYSEMKDYNWDAVYLMSEPNLNQGSPVDGSFNNPRDVSKKDDYVVFQPADPYDTSTSENNLNCLPYKNKLIVSGYLRASSSLNIYPTCEDRSYRKSIGFDFVGKINNNNELSSSMNMYQGLRVLCLSNNKFSKNRGVLIYTEKENSPSLKINGNDVVVLGSLYMKNSPSEVFTYGGDDTLSITGFLVSTYIDYRYSIQYDMLKFSKNIFNDKTSNTKKTQIMAEPYLIADLGKGYNILSFEALPNEMRNRYVVFKGIEFNMKHKRLFFSLETAQKKRETFKQYIGKIKGVNKIYTSSYYNKIILSANRENEETRTKGIEDLSVMNMKGRVDYYVKYSDRDCDGYIRRFLLYEDSENVPRIYIEGPVDESYRVVFRRSRQLRLHCKNSNNEWRIFAIITLIGFKKKFELYYNRNKENLYQLGSIFTEGKTRVINIQNTQNIIFQKDVKQVLLRCLNPSHISNNQFKIRMDPGNNDNTLIIGRKFFMGCDMQPTSYLSDIFNALEGSREAYYEEIERNNYADLSSVKVKSKANSQHSMEIIKGVSSTKITLTNVHRIADDVGNIIIELTDSTDEANLVDNVSKVFADALESFQNSMYFGRMSRLELQVESQEITPETGFTLEFKPEKEGMIMSTELTFVQDDIKYLENVLIYLKENSADNTKKIHLINLIWNESGNVKNMEESVEFPGDFIMEGWNTIKLSKDNANGGFSLSLNGREEIKDDERLISSWDYFKAVCLGFKSPKYAPSNVNTAHGFLGEIKKFTWNEEDIPLRSDTSEANNLDNYD